MGLVNHKEKVVFEELNRRIGRYIQKPDLVIFIDIPPSRSFERVRIRHRDAEMSIDVNYLRMIDRLLKDLIANYSTCPVQRIDGTQYDYVENDMDKNTITEAVHSFVQQVS
jgi:deoxyadenosine/deoxycytidine kinase